MSKKKKKAKRVAFESTISKREVELALAELTSIGIGTTLDRPAAILHRLRSAIVAYETKHGSTT